MMRNRTQVKEVSQVGLGKEHHPGGQNGGAADDEWGLDEDGQGDMSPGCGGWDSSVYPILAVQVQVQVQVVGQWPGFWFCFHPSPPKTQPQQLIKS